MANVSLKFNGTANSLENTSVEVWLNRDNELVINIESKDNDYNSGQISLDKHTSIQLVKEIKKQISFIDNE